MKKTQSDFKTKAEYLAYLEGRIDALQEMRELDQAREIKLPVRRYSH